MSLFRTVDFIEDLAPSTWLRHYLFKRGDLYKTVRGKKILDVGSGTGAFINRLINYTRNIDCLDITRENLEYVGRAFNCVGLIYGDAASLPQIADENYDVILCSGVIEHFDRPEVALKELIRILKPGGLLYITTSVYPRITGWLDKKLYLFQSSFVDRNDPNLHKESKFSSNKFYAYWNENTLIQEMNLYKMKLKKIIYSGGILVNLIDLFLVVIERLVYNEKQTNAGMIKHNYKLNSLPVVVYSYFVLPVIRLICYFSNYIKFESKYCLLQFWKPK